MDKLTVEDLMKVRYKVIAADTSGNWQVGDIYTFDREVAQCYDRWRNQNNTEIHFNYFNIYPHLFKKLEWWEERKESDMPEYVKKKEAGKQLSKWNILYDHKPEPDVHKVVKYKLHYPYSFESEYEGLGYILLDFLPATKEEYENQNKNLHHG